MSQSNSSGASCYVGLESLPGLFASNDGEGPYNEFYFSETSHALRVLQGLNEQRLQGNLCDVIVCVDNQDFPCHRSVLASCSPYFNAMFSSGMMESGTNRIYISGMDAETMSQLIEYSYTSNIKITKENAQNLLSAANLIQLGSIREAACKFLYKEMHPSNCLGIYCFAELHACDGLAQKAKEYALAHFEEVAVHDEIVLLSTPKLTNLISSENLNVKNEETVLDAVITWANHDPELRRSVLGEVLYHVRLPLVSPYFLFDKIEEEAILSATKECRQLLDEAKKIYVLKDRRSQFQSVRTRPRKSMAKFQVILCIGGQTYNKTQRNTPDTNQALSAAETIQPSEVNNYLSDGGIASAMLSNLNCVDLYDPNGNAWIKLKELPFSRYSSGAVVLDAQTVWVVGGFNKDHTVLNSVIKYDHVLEKWTRMGNMGVPRALHGLSALDGKLYAVAGFDGARRVETVEVYNPEDNKWSFTTPLSTPLYMVSAVGLDGFLYVAGGVKEPNDLCVDTFQRFDPRDAEWTSLAPLPVPLAAGTLLPHKDLLYYVGGTPDLIKPSKQIFVYDPEDDMWTELAPMNDARFDPGVTSVNDQIVVISGHDGESSFFANAEVYDIPSNTWSLSTMTNIPVGRRRFACVSVIFPKMAG